MELNAEQAINELETQTKYAKFIGSDGVLLSAKCATFVLEHAQYYEQKIKELTEENERLRADNKTVAKRTVRKFVKMLKSHDCRCDSCINEIKKEIENEQRNFVQGEASCQWRVG